MPVPTPAQLAKRERELAKFMKTLSEDGKPRERDVVSVIRGAIRRAWMKAPQKLAFLYSRTVPDMNPDTRTLWLFQCEHCEQMFKLSDVEVDHKEGNHPFSAKEDFDDYFENILMCGFDDLQLLCKQCHAVKTYADKHGLSLEDAKIEKEVVSVMKQNAQYQVAYIKERGMTPAKNADLRREQVREIIKGGLGE